MGALTRFARRCALVGPMVKREEGGDARVDNGDDITTPAAISPVRPPQGLELLPMNRRTAIATITGGGMDDDTIDEGGHGRRRRDRGRPRVRSGLVDDVDDATTACRAELHNTGAEREQGVVLATTDIVAGVEVRAPLTHDDLTGADDLATE